MKIDKFKELIGGRITYSNISKYSLSLKYDFILYTTMMKYELLKKTRWYSANKVKEQFNKKKMEVRFNVYNNHIITRFYLIRKAIKNSNIEFNL